MNSVPQTAATTFNFSSVCFVFYGTERLVKLCGSYFQHALIHSYQLIAYNVVIPQFKNLVQ